MDECASLPQCQISDDVYPACIWREDKTTSLSPSSVSSAALSSTMPSAGLPSNVPSTSSGSTSHSGKASNSRPSGNRLDRFTCHDYKHSINQFVTIPLFNKELILSSLRCHTQEHIYMYNLRCPRFSLSVNLPLNIL